MDRLEDLSLGALPETLTDTQISRIIGKSPRHVRRLARQGDWPYVTETCRGGRKKKYRFDALPQAVKRAWVEARDEKTTHGEPTETNAHPHGGGGAAVHNGIMENNERINFPPAPKFSAPPLARARKPAPARDPRRALSIDDLRDKRVQSIYAIVQEALSVPPGWGKSKWIDCVALRFGKPRPNPQSPCPSGLRFSSVKSPGTSGAWRSSAAAGRSRMKTAPGWKSTRPRRANSTGVRGRGRGSFPPRGANRRGDEKRQRPDVSKMDTGRPRKLLIFIEVSFWIHLQAIAT